MPFDVREVLEDPALQGDREAPIKLASRECAEQLDKLTAIVATIEDHLESVRRRGPEGTESADDGRPAPAGSPLAMDLRSHAASVRGLQRRLRVLLEELEL